MDEKIINVIFGTLFTFCKAVGTNTMLVFVIFGFICSKTMVSLRKELKCMHKTLRWVCSPCSKQKSLFLLFI